MIRRPSYLTALLSGALMLGLSLGVATSLPRAPISSAFASEQEKKPEPPAPVQGKMKDPGPADKAPPSGKGGPGARCKATKDCQAQMTCVKKGDHKECVLTPGEVPEAPVVT